MEKNTKFIQKIIVGLIFIIILFSFLKYSGLLNENGLRKINIDEIRNLLQSSGKWSVPLFILIYGLKPVVLVIPASILSILAGIIYGPYYGTVYTLIGAFLSATVAFYIAKILGRDTVERILRGKKKIESFDNGIEKNGFKIMLLMRLAFVFPYDALSYAAGLSKMKYYQFILGTMLGVLPEMITYNLFGSNINSPFNKKTIFMVVLVIMLALMSLLLKPRTDNKFNK